MNVRSDQENALTEQLKTEFGLQLDPFSAAASVFYEGGQRQHNIETLRHLAIFGDMVLLLTGEKGAGKTSLLQEFVRQHGNEVSVLQLAAQSNNGQYSCLPRLLALSGLAFYEGESSEETLSRLIQKSEQDYAESGQRVLWVIDDADQLSDTELALYVYAFKILPPESGVALLLVGSQTLVDRLAEFGDHDNTEWLHQVHIKPYSEDETKEYLEARLKSAGMAGELSVTSSQLEQLAEMGKGIPGRINRIFAAVMLGAGEFKPRKEIESNNVGQKVLFGLAALLLASFLFVSYQHGFFSPKVAQDELAEEKDNQAPKNAEELAKRRQLIASKVEQRLAQLDQTSAPVVEEVDRKLPENQSEVVVESVSESVEQTSSIVSEEISDVSSESEAPAAEPLEEAPTPKSETAVQRELQPINKEIAEKETETQVAKVDRHSAYRDASWLRAKGGKGFTLQVLGSRNEETATRFIDSANLTDDSLVYIESTYKKLPWFIVLYGDFKSKDDARSAVTKAPNIVKKQQPWLRSIQSVTDSLPQ